MDIPRLFSKARPNNNPVDVVTAYLPIGSFLTHSGNLELSLPIVGLSART